MCGYLINPKHFFKVNMTYLLFYVVIFLDNLQLYILLNYSSQNSKLEENVFDWSLFIKNKQN